MLLINESLYLHTRLGLTLGLLGLQSSIDLDLKIIMVRKKLMSCTETEVGSILIS